jgi:hypothetical protein
MQENRYEEPKGSWSGRAQAISFRSASTILESCAVMVYEGTGEDYVDVGTRTVEEGSWMCAEEDNGDLAQSYV